MVLCSWYFTVLTVSCSSVNSTVLHTTERLWWLDLPAPLTNAANWSQLQCEWWFLALLLPKCVRVIVQSVSCVLLWLQISMSVRRGNTTAGRTRCVWTHPAPLCVSATPAMSGLMITPAQVSKEVIKMCFFCQGLIRVERRGMGLKCSDEHRGLMCQCFSVNVNVYN